MLFRVGIVLFILLLWIGLDLKGEVAHGFQGRLSLQSGRDFAQQRSQMVELQLRSRGITNPAVLSAMVKVPRHLFVPRALMDWAYEDMPLPIGHNQTISQPYIVAFMTEVAQLTPNQTVLEIGTGSGYQAAILGELVEAVYSIEIIPDLAQQAQQTLRELDYQNVKVRIGDGNQGWAEHAPYDAILVTAAPDRIPAPLLEQLAVDGRVIIPIGVDRQDLIIVSNTAAGFLQRKLLPVRFVPMTGQTA